MLDVFGRQLNYLRVSVTDRCNLSCAYCLPAAHYPEPEQALLGFDQIVEVVRVAVGLGITRVRLTGGEPLLRAGIVDLVADLAGIPGLHELSMTTNGTRLAGLARALATAGLARVNVSLDAIDAVRYARVTNGGKVHEVLHGIAEAVTAGLTPVKLNCVVRQGADEPDAQAVQQFARRHGLQVQFIRRMDLAGGVFYQVIGGNGGDCPRCNRLRLTSHGLIKPCLFSDLAFSVRELGALAALRAAAAAKPAIGTVATDFSIRAVGG